MHPIDNAKFLRSIARRTKVIRQALAGVSPDSPVLPYIGLINKTLLQDIERDLMLWRMQRIEQVAQAGASPAGSTTGAPKRRKSTDDDIAPDGSLR